MKKYIATVAKEEIPLEVEALSPGKVKVVVAGVEKELDAVRIGPGHFSVLIEGRSVDLRFYHEGNKTEIFWEGEHISIGLEDARAVARRKASGKGGSGGAIEGPVDITAVMPGKIVSVKVKVGDNVEEGQGVVVLEAMKMENELASPKKGVVKEVKVTEGQSVESGASLVIIE